MRHRPKKAQISVWQKPGGRLEAKGHQKSFIPEE